MTKEDKVSKTHHGRNVKHFRAVRGIQEEDMAQMLGKEWTEEKISLLEAQEEIESNLLEKVAKILKVDFDYLKNFKEESVYNNVQNNYDSVSSPIVNGGPIGTINNDNTHLIEAMKQIKQLSDEKTELFEKSIEEKKEELKTMKLLLEKLEQIKLR